MHIDWESSSNEILINPRFPKEEGQCLQEIVKKAPPLKGHIWIATSGSTATSSGQYKWVALSKKAILISAQSVNRHLESNDSDIWLNSLPSFHVGGLGIWARAHLSGAKAFTASFKKWDPLAFHRSLEDSRATLISLVPTQLYDLVLHQLKAPHHLRAIIVGGGKLSKFLYQQAKGLGWNVLPSYGLTECSSQVATAPLHHQDLSIDPPLKILSHVSVKMHEEGNILIKSPALLSLYGFGRPSAPQYIDPKVEGWFKTEDRGQVDHNHLIVLGRESHFVKIGGESVDLLRLESILEEVKMEKRIKQDLALIALPHERLGHAIHLCVALASETEIQKLVKIFESRVLPYEKIRQIHFLDYIPRTPTLKLAKAELLKIIEMK